MGPEDQHEQPFEQESYEKWMNSGCTCGPDYFDTFCPRHGTMPPEDKWKELRARPETPKKNYGKSYKQICTENGLARVNQAHQTPEG